MIAIISDIHGNIEALRAVLADIEQKKVEQIVVLGDVVGYGPNPVECLHLVREISPEVVLRGNHEDALLDGCPRNMRPNAIAAIEWTRGRLSPADLDYIQSWPTRHNIGDLMAVHGSPRDHVMEYLFPFDVKRPDKMGEAFRCIPGRHCVVGHTHIPGVFTCGGDYEFLQPADLLGSLYMFGDEKAIINVGSVGQPRDRDPRSCYVTFDGEAVVFRRVEYDFQQTMAKIRATQGLDPSLASRLEAGR